MLTTNKIDFSKRAITSQSVSTLSAHQKQFYQQQGFLILENFIAADLCEMLMNRAQQLIDAFNPQELKSIFFSSEHKPISDLYFLESGDKIRFFFEAEAINKNGDLKTSKNLAINKIGHALHDLDPLFSCFSRLNKISRLMSDLSVKKPLLIQSMYICKQPFIGGEVVCHQDSTYLFTTHEPVIGLWFALEDATIENGCLWAIPGGHNAPLKSRFVREGQQVRAEIYDHMPWPLEKMIPLQVPRGSVIVLHGLLPHMSKENISEHSRHAYSLHLMSSDAGYAPNNWLQRSKEMSFKGFY